MTTPLPLLEPQPVEFRTPISAFVSPVVVECAGDNPVVVLEFSQEASARHGSKRNGQVVRMTTMGKQDRQSFDVPVDIELGDFAVTRFEDKPLRAFSLPPGSVETMPNLGLGLARAVGALFSLSAIPFILVLVPGEMWRALLTALSVGIAVAVMIFRSPRLRSTRHFYRTPEGKTPFARLLDERPALEAATHAVEDIKEEYGRLLSDIIERIEHPALFDPAVDTTRRFTSALIQWDQSKSLLGAAEASALASRVQITFETARAHAQAVGMDHLPPQARGQATRAAKSFRLAASTSNTNERETALRRGVEILDSLMLYYLPRASQVRAMIEGKAQLALPGRRTDDGGTQS